MKRKLQIKMIIKMQTINNFSNNISRVCKAVRVLGMIAILIFIPVLTLSSCNQTSVDEMLEEYNEAFDPDYVSK